jgi:hypothetical protein
MPDAVKNKLEDITARIQGEVGRFLMLKEKIRSLPDGLTRADLLLNQDRLEKAALGLISQGQALKTELESFNPFDIKQVAAIGPKVKRATDLALNGAALVDAIQAHKARVIKEVGSSADLPPLPSAPQPMRGRLVKGAVLAAVVLLPLGFLAAPAVARMMRGKRG